MADLFDEVEGRLRSDRYKAVGLKAVPWVLALVVVLIVGAFGVWGWRHYQQQGAEKASDQYARAIDAMQAGRDDEAFRLFGQVAKSGPKGYEALALMQQGALRLSGGKAAEAVVLFDQAAKAAPDPVLGDAASLKAAFALMDTAPYKDVEARLLPLAKEERPYRVEAREALAFAKLAAGDLAGARSDFVVISLLQDASEAARGRAEAAKTLIDSGSAKGVPAVVKAAALPPQLITPAAPTVGQAPAPQHQTPGSQ
ncbi:tetratricopeptide repeat protein [Phenylobacterium sp.]|uniref:tetratricopeptide repeat protein n=1 Tax=Phenylobacterium sp. TaxID=1871053 RepID=UPI002F4247D2